MPGLSFSIIIPHHNIPQLLERCLTSIPQREDLEVIVVDDNSSPDIVDFDHFPGKERTDVKLILDKKGGGGGYARNLGLEKAKGKWILFADADDFFHPCINEFLNDYIDTQYDMIFFRADSVYTDTLKPVRKSRAIHLNKYIDEYHREREIGTLHLKYLFGEPWSRMIRATLIHSHSILFEETRIHNDTQFGYLTAFYAETVAVDDRICYCITARIGSVSKSLDPHRILTRIGVFGRANKFLKDHSIPVRWEILYTQMAFLYLEDRKLYKQGLNVLEISNVDMSDFKSRMRKKLPKQLIKAVLYKIINKKTY